MVPISAHGLLSLWEQGQGLHSVGQALVMLAAARPDEADGALASLSLGERDRYLLDVRQGMFGPDLLGLAECPGCDERLELEFSVSDLKVPAPAKRSLEFEFDGRGFPFRPVNSHDLAAISRCEDPKEARLSLAKRCLHWPDDLDLTPGLAEALAERLAECDPQAEILLDIECPACSQAWQLVLDIASFLWGEISAEALRLVREVHTLARAYGWREADILSMSAARRRLYLEMVS